MRQSDSEGGQETALRPWKLLPLPLVLLSGCLAFGGGNDVHEALDRELAEMLKSYRQCLEKYEADPAQRKEKCEVYRKTVYDLAPKTLSDRKDRRGTDPRKESS
jgi:hypothetical protein